MRLLVIVACSIATSACKKTECSSPGSPEYNAEVHSMVNTCAEQWMRREQESGLLEIERKSWDDYYDACRALTLKSIESYPGVINARRPVAE